MEEFQTTSASIACPSTSGIVSSSSVVEVHQPTAIEKSSSSHPQPGEATYFGDSSGTSEEEEEGEHGEAPAASKASRGTANKELEPGEYERKREAYWARILFCERKFYGDLRSSYMKIRLRELERSQNDILNQCSPVFLERRAQLDEEFARRREQMRIRRQLQLHSLERVVNGEQASAKMNRNDSRELVVAKKIEAEQARAAKAKELESEGINKRVGKQSMQTIEIKIQGSLVYASTLKMPSGADASEKFEGIERYRIRREGGGDTNPNNNNVNGSEFYWHDVPVVISQLPKHTIKEDLEMLALDAH